MKSTILPKARFHSLSASIILLAGYATCATAYSADFSFQRNDWGTKYQIVMRGEIVAGDAERLSGLISGDPARFILTETINISSPGGEVSEAIELGKVIEASALSAYVARDEVCASACFLLYVSAMYRLSVGDLLVHRPYISLGTLEPARSHEASNNQQDSIYMVRLFLERKSVPSSLIDRMMMLPSTEAYKLTDRDQFQIGYMNPFLEELAIDKCGLANSGVSVDYREGDMSKSRCLWNEVLLHLRYEYLTRSMGRNDAETALESATQLQRLGLPR